MIDKGSDKVQFWRRGMARTSSRRRYIGRRKHLTNRWRDKNEGGQR
jgi:hypothetical protein